MVVVVAFALVDSDPQSLPACQWVISGEAGEAPTHRIERGTRVILPSRRANG